MTWAAVIGSPISHSLSPVLHQAAWQSIGAPQEWIYQPIEVTTETLKDFLGTRPPEMLGLSVTMPLKQEIIALLDAVDPQAQAVGAVNTVIDSGGVLTGLNTDVHGITAALEEGRASADLTLPPQEQRISTAPHTHGADASSPATGMTALILGGRATASSALAALGSLGIRRFSVAARQFAGPNSVTQAAHRLGVTFDPIQWNQTDSVLRAIHQADIVISTMPKGVTDDLAPLISPRQNQTLLDIVYSPWQTPLVRAWKATGGHVVHGSEMLIHQAAMQVRLMTGYTPDLSAMRDALNAARREDA